jgi:peroxiredoxin
LTQRPVFQWSVVALTATLFCGLACSPASSSSAKGVKDQQDRKPAPNFSLKDSNGQTVQLSEYKGQVVLLNFWATWCAPCRIEIPWFKEFERDYKNRGFSVLGVSLDEEGWEVVKPYVEESAINYRILMGNDTVADQYGGVSALPTTFLIDPDGRIAAVHVGLVSKDDYKKDIESLLGKSASGAAPASGANATAVAGAN